MSLERELLQRCLDEFDYKGVACNELCIDINKLLAQPVKYQFTTRLDQESVMYQYRDKLDGKDWGRWNLCNKIDYEDYKNNPTFQHWTYQTRKLLAQPEQEPVAWMNDSGGCFLSDGNKYSENWIPLYTAPQKRKPLSEDKLDALAEANITDEGIAGYYLGFRDAEKMHGIGGGE